VEEANKKLESSQERQEFILRDMQRSMAVSHSLISGAVSTASKMGDTLGWFRQLGIELKDFMRSIIKINVATYNAVISLQSAIPNYPERLLIQQPFVLEDVIGRVTPVDLQFINGWEALDAVLEARFRGLQGSRKTRAKEYIFQDKQTGREISREWRWEGAFVPGQHVEMSLVFKTQSQAPSSDSENSCPGCHSILHEIQNAGVETTW
jgi:hypothetical protein